MLVVDGSQIKTAPEFSASVITTRENSEYKENRIYKEWGSLYEDLHGGFPILRRSGWTKRPSGCNTISPSPTARLP